MPKISRPKSWDGYESIDVIETARRLGRTVVAVRLLVKRKVLKRLDTGDRSVRIAAAEVEAFKRQQKPVQLRLLATR